MGIELGYLTLCNMPVDVNATSPVPQEGEGSIIWSTLVKEILRWDGLQWTIHSSSSLPATTRPSVRPSLLLPFSNTGTLDPRITFTRNGPAYYFDKTGTLVSAAANVPRIDYDPITLECKGLLIEPFGNNYVLYSSDVSNAAWLKVNNGLASAPIVTAKYGVAPDGTTTAARVQLKLNGGSVPTDYCKIYQPVAVTNGTTYSNSIYVRTVDGSTKTIQLRDDLGGLDPAQPLMAVDGKWRRISISGAATGTTSNACSIWLRGGQGTSDNADLLIWGGQLESNAFVSSLITTTNIPLTRAAETATINTLSPWFNPKEGTLFVEAESVGTTLYPAMVSIDDGTSAQRVGLYFSGASQYVASYYRNSGTSYISGTVGNPRGVFAKAVLGMKSGNFMTVVNGVTATPDNRGVVPSTATRMLIGGGDNSMIGHIRRIAYYPIRLVDQELISLTV